MLHAANRSKTIRSPAHFCVLAATSISRQLFLSTGKVVVLTGVTLGIAVATWALSPIKFQADMGILLAFMFIWNMLGALILTPALARLLLTRESAGAPS